MTSPSKTALALAALIAVAAAQAGTTSSIVGVQNYSGIAYVRSECAGCVEQAANTDSSPYGTSTISAYAMADNGVLKASVSAIGQGEGARGSVTASATFGDQFEIDATGLTGQQGYFKAKVTMPFAASVSLEPSTVGSLTAFVSVNGSEGWAEQFGSANGVSSTTLFHNDTQQAIGTPMVLDVPFVYGQPITLLAFLDLQVEGHTSRPYGSFDAVLDAAHSLYWQGISEITDGNGNLVKDYRLSSDSGTDWSRDFSPSAVPEPANAALVLAAIGVLALRRRGARRRG